MYSHIDDPRRWVLTEALDEAAEREPDAPWLSDDADASLSFGEARAFGRRAAGFYERLGVTRGDPVGLFLFNGCHYAIAWLGLGYRAAIAVVLNTELRGAFLRHQLVNAQLKTIVADAEVLPALIEVADQAPELRTVVVVGGVPDDAAIPAHWRIVDWPRWQDEPDWNGSGPRAQDIAAIMYTSGTSGPAKGVLMPHAHCALYGIGTIRCVELTQSDRYYIVLPLFHANGLLMQLGATLLARCSAYTRRRFSASQWLDDIREQKATVTNLLGATSAFVLAQPRTDRDRDHRLRATLNAPNLPAHERAFRERFGIPHVVSGFGMTECNIPIWGRLGQPAPGAAGWVHDDHFEARIVDPETDMPMPDGEMGEIVVRPKVPFGFMAGYFGAPEQTLDAWRNLWFHTGDAGIRRSDGLFTFVDRIRDTIRRRGHNISASEIEEAVAQIDGVAEVAAYPVHSDVEAGEDEVMLAVVPRDGAVLDAVALGRAAAERLPRFASPRYVKLVDGLPRTGTGKVQRAVLRRRGVDGAIDLQA